ncbi:hypothetical protein ACUJ46_11920 [Sandaracinobacteroides sp. A072]|uniref:hypothetical protein n=1 Tax=Sandaracinobacteroides sp. A072 TaxID=3461146 RepID=UPI004040F7EA
MRKRVREPSTWAGLAMIAIVMGSDPMQAHGIVQAVSLIIGGGLVTAGPPADGDAGDDDPRSGSW